MNDASGYFDFILPLLGEALFSIIVWVVIAFIATQFILFFFKDKIIAAIKNNKTLEILFSSLLGFIPGCGGSIFLIPLYKEKIITFGALCAAFITTLGETTFILLFFNPMAFLIFSALSFIVAIVVGYLINIYNFESKLNLNTEKVNEFHIHQPPKKENIKPISKQNVKIFESIDKFIIPIILIIVVFMVLPLTFIISFVPNAEDNLSDSFRNYMNFANYLSVGLLIIFVPYKLFRDYFEKRILQSSEHNHFHSIHSNAEIGTEDYKIHKQNRKEEFYHELHHTFITLIFIIFWIYVSIFLIDTLFYFASDNFALNESSTYAVDQNVGYRFLILIFVLSISLIPVCGPQIFIVTLFGQGFISFSALSANSISQNGHAGLAMLSVDKKSYFWLKAIIIVPAFIIGLFFLTIEATTNFDGWMLNHNVT